MVVCCFSGSLCVGTRFEFGFSVSRQPHIGLALRSKSYLAPAPSFLPLLFYPPTLHPACAKSLMAFSPRIQTCQQRRDADCHTKRHRDCLIGFGLYACHTPCPGGRVRGLGLQLVLSSPWIPASGQPAVRRSNDFFLLFCFFAQASL